MRTRIKKEIIAEFLAPKRPSHKVIIFCDGLPAVPSKRPILEFWSKKGFWVFHPRYRGTWESGGKLFRKSPVEDILDLATSIRRAGRIIDLWSGEIFEIEVKEIFVIGSSFGGTAALLAAESEFINKVVAFSPVTDWRAPSKAEPLDWFFPTLRSAFGQAYRFGTRDWKKLLDPKFFNPIDRARQISGQKVFIFHSTDDEVVPVNSVKKFIKTTGAAARIRRSGGHLSVSESMKFSNFRQIKKFFRMK